jgi:hypothetical protein
MFTQKVKGQLGFGPVNSDGRLRRDLGSPFSATE